MTFGSTPGFMSWSGEHLGVEPKNRGIVKPPKMDGENNGSKPYEQMDDLGGFIPLFLETPIWFRGIVGEFYGFWAL